MSIFGDKTYIYMEIYTSISIAVSQESNGTYFTRAHAKKSILVDDHQCKISHKSHQFNFCGRHLFMKQNLIMNNSSLETNDSSCRCHQYEVRLHLWISLAVSRHVVVSKSNLLLTSYFNLQESEANLIRKV